MAESVVVLLQDLVVVSQKLQKAQTEPEANERVLAFRKKTLEDSLCDFVCRNPSVDTMISLGDAHNEASLLFWVTSLRCSFKTIRLILDHTTTTSRYYHLPASATEFRFSSVLAMLASPSHQNPNNQITDIDMDETLPETSLLDFIGCVGERYPRAYLLRDRLGRCPGPLHVVCHDMGKVHDTLCAKYPHLVKNMASLEIKLPRRDDEEEDDDSVGSLSATTQEQVGADDDDQEEDDGDFVSQSQQQQRLLVNVVKQIVELRGIRRVKKLCVDHARKRNQGFDYFLFVFHDHESTESDSEEENRATVDEITLANHQDLNCFLSVLAHLSVSVQELVMDSSSPRVWWGGGAGTNDQQPDGGLVPSLTLALSENLSHIENVRLDEPAISSENDLAQLLQAISSCSTVRGFILEMPRITQEEEEEALSWNLDGLSNLTSLTTLKITTENSFDDATLTFPIVSLLNNPHNRLETLDIRGNKIEKPDPIVEAALASSKLKSFGCSMMTRLESWRIIIDHLETHNCTMVEILPNDLAVRRRRVRAVPRAEPWLQHAQTAVFHYCTLNGLGRARLRKTQITPEEFVGILADFETDDSFHNFFHLMYHREDHDAYVTGLTFGVLRENPAVWSEGLRTQT